MLNEEDDFSFEPNMSELSESEDNITCCMLTSDKNVKCKILKKNKVFVNRKFKNKYPSDILDLKKFINGQGSQKTVKPLLENYAGLQKEIDMSKRVNSATVITKRHPKKA